MPKYMMEACLSQGLLPVSMSTVHGTLRKKKKHKNTKKLRLTKKKMNLQIKRYGEL